MQRLEHRACFGGWQDVVRHRSDTLNCDMNVGVYLPPQAATQRCPVLYWLSGLTCTEQNAITKSGMQRYAAEHGLIIVTPDTSPRGAGVADAEGYDLGLGAGFYVDATQQPWAAHYRMHDYVARELPVWIEANFPATDARSISGHSMGGHGALVFAMRHPGRYRSVSAFAPIVAPSQVPWGQKAFGGYLADRAEWSAWDTIELTRTHRFASTPLIDQGLADKFLERELRPELLEEACRATEQPVRVRRHPGYDHSYYFIATFVEDHLRHHSATLRNV